MEKQEETKRIFRLLKKESIPFIILRGHDFLWDRGASEPVDLDILIPEGFVDPIKRFFRGEGYYSVYSSGLLDHMMFRCTKPSADITFDVEHGWVRERNIAHLSYKTASKYVTIVAGEFPALDGAGLAFHLIARALVGKGTFRQRHKTKILEILRSPHKEGLGKLLAKCFGARRCGLILDKILKDQFSDLEGRKWEYLFRFIVHNPSALYPLLKYDLLRLRRIFPRGMVLSFIGLDGTGKTTLAKALVELLKERGLESEYIYMGRLRGHALPMHSVSKKIGVSKIEKTKKPSKAYFLAREFAYYCDLLTRYFLLILPRVLAGTVMVCDRYAYDFFLDTHFSAFSRFLFRFLYPRPALLVFLDLPEEEIIRRKNEYDRGTRHFYYSRWREVRNIFGARVVVSDNVERNTDAVYEWVIQHLLPDPIRLTRPLMPKTRR